MEREEIKKRQLYRCDLNRLLVCVALTMPCLEESDALCSLAVFADVVDDGSCSGIFMISELDKPTGTGTTPPCQWYTGCEHGG